MPGRLRDPVLGGFTRATWRLSYCPGYLHKAPLADQLPPTFAHRSWSEGSTPGCISLAQPARGESSESTHTRVSTVAANLTVVLLRLTRQFVVGGTGTQGSWQFDICG